ncbi:MAG: hypothetical protein WKF96_19225 [Solirubrobacteraceae bacterium]
MYALHTLGWAEAHERSLDQEAAEALIRRMEVVTAAIHHVHQAHRVKLSTAHGEDALDEFLVGDRLDIDGASELGGLSRRGFAAVYQGPCVRVGALTEGTYPRPGPRADLAGIRDGLGGLLRLAQRSSLTVDELQAAGDLCLCMAGDAQDGQWLREVLVEKPGDRSSAQRRQMTCGLLLDAIADSPSRSATAAFRARWAFGLPEGEPEANERSMVAALWRAAALRNFSVGAWRSLWRWLTGELRADPMTAQQLADRFADALDDVTVVGLLDGLPDRMDGDAVRPAEVELLNTKASPLRDVRMLALGAQRLHDLHGPTLKAFVGTDPNDLGPRWVAGLLGEARNRHVRDVARELAVILVRRAQRVALSKMEMRKGRPYVPTRLRDRDGILWVRGEEGAGEVALRTDSLADVLAGIGYLDIGDGGLWGLTTRGEDLRGQLA